MTPPSPIPSKGRPWGATAALLGASAVVLIGVIGGLDPEIILCRAVIGGLVLGVLASISRYVINQLLKAQ